jgi:hypothetical protein
MTDGVAEPAAQACSSAGVPGLSIGERFAGAVDAGKRSYALPWRWGCGAALVPATTWSFGLSMGSSFGGSFGVF